MEFVYMYRNFDDVWKHQFIWKTVCMNCKLPVCMKYKLPVCMKTSMYEIYTTSVYEI